MLITKPTHSLKDEYSHGEAGTKGLESTKRHVDGMMEMCKEQIEKGRHFYMKSKKSRQRQRETR